MTGNGSGFDSGFEFSVNRVAAMVRRYWYLLRSSWPRILDLIYWPAVQMLMWGFLQLYVSQSGGLFARTAGVFIGAVLLWDILFRGQLGFSISFLEEMWSRNLGNIMISPLRPVEFIAALLIMSIVRLLIGMIPVTLLALAFFGFNLWSLGFALVAFFINLILTSCRGSGFLSPAVVAQWHGAEWLGHHASVPAAHLRYYPVAVLPHWLQYVAWSLPPTYVFEGMRALLIDHVFRADLMLQAFAFNIVLFAVASFAFLKLLASAREQGALLQTGE
jgi:ABC-2 type transport system permease protein